MGRNGSQCFSQQTSPTTLDTTLARNKRTSEAAIRAASDPRRRDREGKAMKTGIDSRHAQRCDRVIPIRFESLGYTSSWKTSMPIPHTERACLQPRHVFSGRGDDEESGGAREREANPYAGGPQDGENIWTTKRYYCWLQIRAVFQIS